MSRNNGRWGVASHSQWWRTKHIQQLFWRVVHRKLIYYMQNYASNMNSWKLQNFIRNIFWKISKYPWRPSNQSMFSICPAYSVSFSPSVWWRWATNEFLMQLRWPKQPLVWRLLFFRRLGCSFCRATRSAAMLVPIGCLGCTPNSSTYTPTV